MQAADRHTTHDHYGWASIGLHWLSAALVIVLWIAGKSIDGAADVDAQRSLHMLLGVSAWLVLAFRIAWRVREGHPRVAGISNVTHRIAVGAHYAMLIVLTILLLSGPLMAWANGAAIPVPGAAAIPAPFPPSEALATFARGAHGLCANLLLLLVLLHVAGALKHLMFANDDVFVRMLWPGRAPGPDKTAS